MNRDKKMTITLPKECEEDFRLFIVLHGGSIESCVDFNETDEVIDEDSNYSDGYNQALEDLLESMEREILNMKRGE